MLKTGIGYLRANWLFSLVIAYMLLSCILKIATGVNITIPCLFTTFLGIHCPGCGLTSAFIELLKLSPARAWDHNPLIFLVIPIAGATIIFDFLRFWRRTHNTNFTI